MNKKVAILLATHNSEGFLKEQLNSILSQTYNSISITVSDDASKDGTKAILNDYAEKYKNISLIESPVPLKSAQANFWFLLKNAPEADYYMFCDHDDVWLNNKVETTLNKMLETDNGKPALVHTDLFVTDSALNITSNSMFELQKLLKSCSLEQALVQNNVTGCTVMINNELRKLALQKEDVSGIIMHDWFLSILCLATGSVGFVDEPLIYYRQHANNEVGAKDVSGIGYILKRATAFKENKKSLRDTYLQAQAIYQAFGEITPQFKIINEYAQNLNRNKFKRISVSFKYGFWKTTFLRRLGQIIFM